MDHFPPPSRPASFRLRHLVRLRIVPNRWPYSLGAAFCVAAPVAFGWSVGDVPAGLVASIGAFTALYGAGRPYNNRALVLAAIAVGLACAVGLGAWSQPFGRLGIATVVLVATCATFFCNALRIGPPGAYMFALAGAIGTSLPTQHLDWWHAALLVLAGGGFSTVVRVAGVLTDTRRPERTAVASAGTAVARFLKSVGGPDEDAARHAAAVTLHDTWTMLVSRQPARSADDGTLIRLRSISRELHRLFVDWHQCGWSLCRPGCARRAGSRPRRRGALESRRFHTRGARTPAAREARRCRVPAGKPHMAISHSGRLAPRRLGGGDSGISGSRTGPGTRLLDRSRRRSHRSPRLGLEPQCSARFRAHYRHFARARPRGSGALARTAGSVARFDACGLAIPHLYAGGGQLRLGRHLHHRPSRSQWHPADTRWKASPSSFGLAPSIQ